MHVQGRRGLGIDAYVLSDLYCRHIWLICGDHSCYSFSSDAQTRFPRECKTIAKRCADKKAPLNYREAASLAAKLEAVKCLGDTAICEKILNAEPIGVEYFRQVLELCGETRAVKSTQDLLSFDEKSWTCDGRYCAFT